MSPDFSAPTVCFYRVNEPLPKPASPPPATDSFTPLYRAQSAALHALETPLFPVYSSTYIQEQTGLKKKVLWLYTKAQEGLHAFHHSLSETISKIVDIIVTYLFKKTGLLDKVILPIANTLYPMNLVNGQRHFAPIPRSFEKFLGDHIIYPLTTSTLRTASHKKSCLVDSVLDRLICANQPLLNPPNTRTPFTYRVKTLKSDQLNAFAVPGGGMVVYSQLISDLTRSIEQNQIRMTSVQLADGSYTLVDLSRVTLEDTIAALLGHEITHAASRHGIISIIDKLARFTLLTLGTFFVVFMLKRSDKEYQELKSKPWNRLNESERRTLIEKENAYYKMSQFGLQVRDILYKMRSVFHSRKNEYEADVTGTYLAHQAGFNPLGALYLQEFLRQNEGCVPGFFHKHLECFFTHPYGENRKRAIFAAIQSINPNIL